MNIFGRWWSSGPSSNPTEVYSGSGPSLGGPFVSNLFIIFQHLHFNSSEIFQLNNFLSFFVEMKKTSSSSSSDNF